MALQVNSGTIGDIRFGVGYRTVASIPIAMLGNGSVVFESKRNIFAYGPNYYGTYRMAEFAEGYDKGFFFSNVGGSTVNVAPIVYDMAYGNGTFVALCLDGSNARIYKSKYGGKWSLAYTFSLPYSARYNAMKLAFNESSEKFACVVGCRSSQYGVNYNYFASSSDGETWSVGSSYIQAGLLDFGPCGAGFLVLFTGDASYSTNAYYSTDGLSYTKQTGLSSTSVVYNGFAVNASGLIALIGYNATTYRLYSKTSLTSGSVTLRKSTTSDVGLYNFITYSSVLGKFVAKDNVNTDTVLVSSNGTTWTSGSSMPSSPAGGEYENQYWRRRLFEYDGYLWLASNGTKYLFRTSDGSSWSRVEAAGLHANFGYVFSPNRETA